MLFSFYIKFMFFFHGPTTTQVQGYRRTILSRTTSYQVLKFLAKRVLVVIEKYC